MAVVEREYGWPVDRQVLLGISSDASPVHRGLSNLRYAVDFMVPLESNVIAMADGIVSSIKKDSKDGGDDLEGLVNMEKSKFYDTGNRIEIYHGDNKFTAYEHIAPNSSPLKKGDFVVKGEIIAKTGYTGLMAGLGPHLHSELFYIFGEGEEDFQTLSIPWERRDALRDYYLSRDEWMAKLRAA